MLTTPMIVQEYNDRRDSYIREIKILENRLNELTADRTTLLKCWMSATDKLRELGYSPKMDNSGTEVEEWRFEPTK